MTSLRCIVLLAAVAGTGCKPSGPRRCPDGMKVLEDRSPPGKELWCKSADGARAQWTKMFPDGRRFVCNYRSGKAEGTVHGWYPTGKKWLLGEYLRGLKSGTWSQWHPHGIKVAQGQYGEGRFRSGSPVGAQTVTCEKQTP